MQRSCTSNLVSVIQPSGRPRRCHHLIPESAYPTMSFPIGAGPHASSGELEHQCCFGPPRDYPSVVCGLSAKILIRNHHTSVADCSTPADPCNRLLNAGLPGPADRDRQPRLLTLGLPSLRAKRPFTMHIAPKPIVIFITMPVVSTGDRSLRLVPSGVNPATSLPERHVSWPCRNPFLASRSRTGRCTARPLG